MIALPQKLDGVIARYKGDGRKLGYPTANIDTQTALPDGVYFGYAAMGDFRDHPTIIFIGIPVTMGETVRRVEAHILDIPDKDYYGQPLQLDVQHFHRPNQKFADVDALLVALKDDEVAARDWFTKRKEA